jgi:putative iron-regulated protein
VVDGPSLQALVKEVDAALATELAGKLDASVARLEAIQVRASGGEAYDQQIAEGNAEVQAAIDALVDQTTSIERAVAALRLDAIEFEGSDSLDAPDKVFE